MGVINMKICMRIPKWSLYRIELEANRTLAGWGGQGVGPRGGGGERVGKKAFFWTLGTLWACLKGLK